MHSACGAARRPTEQRQLEGFPAWQFLTNSARCLPLSFLAVASRLQDLSVGCLIGVADGAAGTSLAAATPQPRIAATARALQVFMSRT